MTANEQSVKSGETLNMIVGDSIDFSSNNYFYLPNTAADFDDLVVVLSDSSYADESYHIIKEGDFKVTLMSPIDPGLFEFNIHTIASN